MKLDYSLISEIELDGIDGSDAPDFSDAYISYALYDGREATEEELDAMNDDRGFVYEHVLNYLY